MKLSVCYIVLNGERTIEKSINSIHEIADEIIVVDSFSTDKTKEICTGFPKVKFIQKKFHGFGCQKNYTLSEASGEWVLFLDSDEVPDKTAVQAIRDVLNNPDPPYKVYEIHFNNILLKKTIKYGGWGNVWRERFFKKGHGKYTDDLVHECFVTQDKKGKLPGNIDHYTYKSIAHHIEKINSYTQLMAEKKVSNGKSVSILKIIFAPFFDFMKTYFFKFGFLDGVAGFYISITGAFYTFLKYIKINELVKFK